MTFLIITRNYQSPAAPQPRAIPLSDKKCDEVQPLGLHFSLLNFLFLRALLLYPSQTTLSRSCSYQTRECSTTFLQSFLQTVCFPAIPSSLDIAKFIFERLYSIVRGTDF